jgi:lysophospholipid acyltransferase
MDAFFDKLAHQLSSNGAITGDQLKLVVSILSSYFFAYAYRYLPANGSTSRVASIRHMYSISIALYTTLIFLKLYTGFLHISLTSLITFLLIKHSHSSIAPWINFAVVMVSMSLW